MENVKLTEKEIQVIELKSDGLTNMEISKKLFTNIKTVKRILNVLYGKTSSRNSAQLTKWAIKEGVLKIKYQRLQVNDDRAA